MKRCTLTTSLAILVITGASAIGEEPELIPRNKANLSLRNEVGIAIDKGLAWLETQQKPEGNWSSAEYPALTALPLTAFMREPSGRYQTSPPASVKKGYDFILGMTQSDGGIYKPEKGLANYNTSISVMALVAAHTAKYETAISAARDFIIGQQAKGLADESLNGGIGYGPIGTNRQHPDMNNTLLALEALSASKALDAGKELSARKELDRKALIGFLERCQNLPAYNTQPWASDDPENKGGFIYFPASDMAGETQSPGGRKAFKSFGSVSYAGLLSYIYAELSKNDPRVIAVFDWLKKNYTLEENPGMGTEGLYYYYHTMAKALATYGLDTFEMPDGKKVNWRTDLALKLINLQHPEGFWASDDGRFMEKDPVLASCYSILALEVIYHDM